ncbi:MAG: sugar ABC transporter permease [Clostridia bacterium]|nr:sugar ABC transporter permease [Clostridia bacterium]MDD6040807.1 sugar ABC transporter permease [Clostridia bacterium]
MERSLKRWWPLFVLPTALAFLVGFLIPFGMGLYLSFCDFTTLSDAVYVGVANYIKAFSDASGEFVHALWYTALFAVVSSAIINVLALGVALLLTRGFPGTNAFRTVFFLPNLIGGIVLGWLWQVLLNGVLARWNETLVTSEWYGFWGLMLVVCWQQLGYMMIIYISGLTTIPEEVMEAAAIDGASARQAFWHVRLPMLMPSVTICTFLTLTNGFKLFDQNLALTNGMPGNRSQLLALNIYTTFYGRTGWAGAGQAKAVVFCLIVVSIALLQLRLTRSQEASG